MNVQYRKYQQLDDIPLTKTDWDNLVANSNVGGIFLSYAWIRAWWQYLGSQYQLFFVTAESDDSVLGFAPLMLDDCKTLRFIGDINADYLGFVIPSQNAEILAGMLAYISAHDSDWSTMHLRNIPRSLPQVASLADACRPLQLYPWNNYSVTAPYLSLSGNEQTIGQLLSKYSMRRAERQLADQGELSFEVLRTDTEAAPYWRKFAQQHVQRCQIDGRHSPFESADYLEFLRNLFKNATSQYSVHFSVLLLNGEPVAFHYGFVSQNKLLWYKPCFKTGLSKSSPGIVLIKRLIELANQEGFDEFDFTIGAEAFKSRYTSRFRMVDTFRIFQSKSRFHFESGYWKCRHFAKRLISLQQTRRSVRP